MSRVRTHYDNLKVARDAPVEIIHAAFRTLAAKYHPDVNPGNHKTAEIFRIINRSYEALCDPTKRAEHDRWIAEQESPVFTPPVFQTEEKRPVNKWIVGGCVGTAVVAVILLAFRAGREPGVQPKRTSETQQPQPSALTPALGSVPSFEEFKANEARSQPQPTVSARKKTQGHNSPRSEIDEVIHSGKYSQLPPAVMVSPATGSGPSHQSLVNQTIYDITVTYDGPTERSVTIPAHDSLEVEIAPGQYRVLCRASNPLVVPFVGDDEYAAGAGYKSAYSIHSQIVP